MSEALEKAAKALEYCHVVPLDVARGRLMALALDDRKTLARAAITAFLSDEEALLMAVADAIEDSNGYAEGSYSAAKAAIAGLRALLNNPDKTHEDAGL